MASAEVKKDVSYGIYHFPGREAEGIWPEMKKSMPDSGTEKGLSILYLNSTPSEPFPWGIYSGMVPSGKTAEISIVNTAGTAHSLSINKQVAGNIGDKTRNFQFELMLEGEAIPDVLAYTKGEETGIIEYKDGAAAFSLAHGENIIFENIPDGLTYQVVEMDGESGGYQVESANASGKLVDDISVSFINTKNTSVPTSGDTNIKIIVLLSAIALAGVFLVIYLRRKTTCLHTG